MTIAKRRKTNARTHPAHRVGVSGAERGKSIGKAVCGACRREFTPTRHWQRFCSTDCRRAFWTRGGIVKDSLAELESRVRFIEKKLGIKKGG